MNQIESPFAQIARLIGCLPDAFFSFAYLATWYAPLSYDADAVRFLMLVMLMEFLMVHSGGFLGVTLFSDQLTRRKKTLLLLGLGTFYMLFVLAFAMSFHSLWPVWTFLSLLAGKLVLIWFTPLPRDDEIARQRTFWSLSVAFYLGAVFAGILIPLPSLGLKGHTMSQLGLSGGGLWVEHPETVLASGMLYFALLAWSKWAYKPSWANGFKSTR